MRRDTLPTLYEANQNRLCVPAIPWAAAVLEGRVTMCDLNEFDAGEDASTVCEFCGEERILDLLECWPEERAWLFDTCCEEFHNGLLEELEYASELSAQERKAYLQPLRDLFAGYGIDIRQAFKSESEGAFRLDYGLELVEIAQADAKAFVAKHHRHNKPPVGWKWGHALVNGSDVVAVAMVGRPVARMIDGNTTVEVNRLCVDPDVDQALVWNACSMLYAATAKEAERRGFSKVITYTLESEPGTTLKAAGWQQDAIVKGRSWNCASRPREDAAPTCNKVRWARQLKPRRQQAAAA